MARLGADQSRGRATEWEDRGLHASLREVGRAGGKPDPAQWSTGEQPRWLVSQQRWRARYIDSEGKRRSVYSAIPGRVGAREAAARRDEAIRRAELGVVSNPRLTVGDLLERWLTEVAPLRLRPSSLERYRGIIRGQLVPILGRIPLASLTPEHVAHAYAELAAPREVTITHARAQTTATRARSAAAIRYAHAVLHHALEQAVAWRLIERNPALGAVLPRRSRPEMRPLTTGEARRFLEAVRNHPLEALFTLALTSGMRQGELLGLRWRDVDWAARRISVHHTLVRMHGRWWLGDPKTPKSERSVTLTEPTLDLLRAHRAHQAERLLTIGHRTTDDDFVFSDEAGEPLWGRHVTTREFGPLLRRAELPPIRFHDLRHTFATLQLAAGTNPKIVSEVLGHKDVAITLDRYSHAMPTMQAEAMGRLDAMLGRAAVDAPEVDDEAPEEPTLWLDQPSGTAPAQPLTGHKGADKGADKGASSCRRATERPDLSSDRAETGEFGTAYRIRTDDLRLERAVS
jgi:integrase